MLTGELPLKADSTIEQLMAHINVPPKPVKEVRPQIPDSVAAAVMRCLEKKPELRPATGQALIEEIEAAATRRTVPLGLSSALTTQQVVPPRTARLKVIRNGNPARRSLPWVVTAVLIAGFLGTAWYLRGRKPTSEAELAVVTGPKPAPPPSTEPLTTASAQRPNVSLPSEPTPSISETVRRSKKGPEDAQKPAQASMTASRSELFSKGSVPSAKAPEVTPEPPETTPTASPEKSPAVGVNDSTAERPTSPVAESRMPSSQAAVVSPMPSVSAATLGSLEIETQHGPGGARVHLDGQLKGKTSAEGSLTLPNLSVGRHGLRLSYEGYQDYTADVDVVAGPNKLRASFTDGTAPTTHDGISRFYVAHFNHMHTCTGTLVVGNKKVEYETKGKDRFVSPVTDIVEVKNGLELWESTVKLTLRNGKKYTFRPTGESVDTIVEAIRQEMRPNEGEGHAIQP